MPVGYSPKRRQSPSHLQSMISFRFKNRKTPSPCDLPTYRWKSRVTSFNISISPGLPRISMHNPIHHLVFVHRNIYSMLWGQGDPQHKKLRFVSVRRIPGGKEQSRQPVGKYQINSVTCLQRYKQHNICCWNFVKSHFKFVYVTELN